MKLLLSASLCLVALTGWIGRKTGEPPHRVAVSTSVNATLGQAPGCIRHGGICTISPSGYGHAPPAAGYPAIAGFTVTGRFFIEFQLSAMPADAYVAEFGSGIFKMEQPCPVPAAVLEQLGRTSDPYSIPVGQYTPTIADGKLRVIF